jgi:hypothetical protein
LAFASAHLNSLEVCFEGKKITVDSASLLVAANAGFAGSTWGSPQAAEHQPEHGACGPQQLSPQQPVLQRSWFLCPDAALSRSSHLFGFPSVATLVQIFMSNRKTAIAAAPLPDLSQFKRHISEFGAQSHPSGC